MATAFILIITDVAKEKDVLIDLMKIKEVVSVDIVYGIYDLVVKIKAENLSDLKRITTEGLRHVNNIRSTMTMIAVE